MYDAALEEAILDSPSFDAYSVYGDWFEQHGHPRGELIALQIEHAHAKQRKDRRSAKALQQLANVLLQSHPDALGRALPGVEPNWYCGFWQSVTIDADAVDLAAVLAHPSARVLQTIRWRNADTWDRASLHRTSDEELAVRSATLDGIARMMRKDCDARRWLPSLPALERLRMGAAELVLVDRALGAMNGHAIASIRGLAELYLNTRMYSFQSITRDAFRALSPLAGSLAVLAAANCTTFDDDTCAMLASFDRLEELHIANTNVTAAGIARLPQLRVLDVRGCNV